MGERAPDADVAQARYDGGYLELNGGTTMNNAPDAGVAEAGNADDKPAAGPPEAWGPIRLVRNADGSCTSDRSLFDAPKPSLEILNRALEMMDVSVTERLEYIRKAMAQQAIDKQERASNPSGTNHTG